MVAFDAARRRPAVLICSSEMPESLTICFHEVCCAAFNHGLEPFCFGGDELMIEGIVFELAFDESFHNAASPPIRTWR